MKSALEQVGSQQGAPNILSPLDLSHSLNLTNHNSTNGDDDGLDDTRSEDFDSDIEEEIDFDYLQSSNPSSPNVSCRVGSSRNSSNQYNSGVHSINSNSKRFRTQMTSVMLKVMKSIFADYKTPTMAECEALGREVGLPKRVVQVWFQNARAKEKKARIAFSKTFGQEFDLNTPTIEQCQICNIKYNYKLSSNAMQEHLFSKSHLQKLKAHIDSLKKMVEGQDDNSTDFPVASGHPIPPTMLVNPHSTSSIFSSVPNADPSKTASFLHQLQLIQGLAAVSQGAQLPINLSELFNGNNSNSSMNGEKTKMVANRSEEKEENDLNEDLNHFNDNSSNLSANNFRQFLYTAQDGAMQ